MDSLSVRQVDSSTVWFAGLVIEDIGLLGKVPLYAGNLHMDTMHGMHQSQLVKVNMFNHILTHILADYFFLS